MCSTPFESKRQSVGVQTRSRTSKEIKSELLPETLPVHVYISLRSCSIPHGLQCYSALWRVGVVRLRTTGLQGY